LRRDGIFAVRNPHKIASAFDEDFYLPPGKGDGVLLEKVGPTLPEVTEYTLEQARDGF
jgi:hypothetical protein